MNSFDDYRDRMLAIIANAETLLRTDRSKASDELDLARARMSRILTAYHLYADRELFTPCMSRATPAQRLRIRAVASECAVLAQEFRAFTRQCIDNPVIGRWAEYRVASYAMMARIRRHLHNAEAEVRLCEIDGATERSASPRLLAG